MTSSPRIRTERNSPSRDQLRVVSQDFSKFSLSEGAETSQHSNEPFRSRVQTPRRSLEGNHFDIRIELENRSNSPFRPNNNSSSNNHNKRPGLRSHHSLNSLTAPPMTRAHSSPIFSSSQLTANSNPRSQSPLRSPRRARSPLRQPGEDGYYPTSSISNMSLDIESISEDQELKIAPRPFMPAPSYQHSPLLSSPQFGYASSTSQRPSALATPLSSSSIPSAAIRNSSSRRSISPLPISVSSSRLGTPPPSQIGSSSSTTSSAPHSPLLTSIKYNETFVTDLQFPPPMSTRSASFSSTSYSVPSTPTSIRSRSPSISGLETITDTPDEEAEEEAQDEADKLERLEMQKGLMMAAVAAGDQFRRGSTPESTGGGVGGGFTVRFGGGGIGGFGGGITGGGGGGGNKWKRWSVCGAEKRSDLNLETIWED